MKYFTKSIPIFLLITVLLSVLFSVPANATNENRASEYQEEFDNLVEKYCLDGKISCTITEIPNESLTSFSYRYDILLKFLSDNIVYVGDYSNTEKVSRTSLNKSTFSSDGYWTNSGYKYCSIYFRVYCQYRKENRSVVDVNDGMTMGAASVAGALLAFTFTQNGLGWHRLMTNGTAEIYCQGKWIDNKNNVPVVMGENYLLVVVAK